VDLSYKLIYKGELDFKFNF